MTSAETIVAEAGSFGLASQALYYLREAVRQNWVKVGVSFAVAGPDARWPKPDKAVTRPAADGTPKAANGQARDANGRFIKTMPLHEAGTEAA